ncbi:MAG: aminoacyl-tRNA hydrolase [Rickettsiales bacterium]|nr:aminoacyl-tRNA hydrolase [Rickettsiales bacterium]
MGNLWSRMVGLFSRKDSPRDTQDDGLNPMTAPQLLVGLGNPGKDYAQNRHNIGFMVVDALADQYRFNAWKKAFGGMICEGQINTHKVLLFKPLSYMNLSGEPTQKAARFYKIPVERVTAFHDELDLPLGKLRAKRGGGHGGHNGLKSLDAQLGKDYQRVRIGIGHPGDKDRVADYVLSDFAKAERATVETLVQDITRHIIVLLDGDEAGFMNKIALTMKDVAS